jgi:hypothetical protein
MNRLLALSLISALTAACGTSGSGDDEWGDGLGDPENPVPGSAEDGPYTTRTMMDFTAEQLLPPTVEDVVVVLRTFGENPAKGLIKAADTGGLVVLEELYSVLPGVLKDKFEGWLNGEINKIRINGKTLAQYSAQLAMLAEHALTKFALESDLALTPTSSTHTLTAIDFRPVGIDARIPITGIASDVLTQHPTVLVEAGGKLTLGDQTFGLRIGEYAWAGANAGIKNLFGKDIATQLTSSINCGAIAGAISDKCVLSVCVGHESMIKEVCTGSVNLFIDQLHNLFAILNLDAFHMAMGNAILVDDTGDGIADRIIDGVWDSEMNIGLGMRKAPSTFDGSRPGAGPVTL